MCDYSEKNGYCKYNTVPRKKLWMAKKTCRKMHGCLTFGVYKETFRVNRGGSWNNNARNVRAANRNRNSANNRNNNLGFRLCVSQARHKIAVQRMFQFPLLGTKMRLVLVGLVEEAWVADRRPVCIYIIIGGKMGDRSRF